MAYHVYNRLTLEGPEADIDRLNALVLSAPEHWYEGETLDFSAILPGCCCATDYEVGGNDNNDCFDAFFQTRATGPAHDLMTALAAQFPTLEGTYSAGDPDEDWVCHNEIKDGQYEEGVSFEPEEQERICCGMPAVEGDEGFEDDEGEEDEDEFDDEGEDA
jgi:hypothetical protein